MDVLETDSYTKLILKILLTIVHSNYLHTTLAPNNKILFDVTSSTFTSQITLNVNDLASKCSSLFYT